MINKPPQRLGIFGGSFDPVHYAHLLLAESCREQCNLDEVWLLPAASAPHKLQRQPTSARHRVEMLRLAIGGHRALHVSTLEIDRGGISYTFETLEAIHQQSPETELFFLMGADSLEDLPHLAQPRAHLPVGCARCGPTCWFARTVLRIPASSGGRQPAGTLRKLPGNDADHRIGQ